MLESIKYDILIKQYKNNIYGYALYMLKNEMDADDITQEVFIRIWKNIGRFRIKSAGAWIMRTTHNLCIDYLRKKQVAAKREVDTDTGLKNNISGGTTVTDTEVNFRKNLIKNKIREGVEKLPENLKSIFVLYELQGYKYKEISETLDMPINSVKVYLMRARQKLQEELKELRNEYEN